MRLTIELKKLVGRPLLILEIAVFLLCFLRIMLSVGYLIAGLIYALPFSIVTVVLVRMLYIALLAPCCGMKDVIEFTPDAITLRRGNETVKRLPRTGGLNVYRYGGILRSSIVFSTKKLPQGEILRKYRRDPEVIYFPYIAKKMPKLAKYYDKATRI